MPALFAPDFALALVIAAVAGIVRGFSGFGSAMLMAPPLTALYNPPVAIPMIALMEFGVGLTLLPKAVPMARWPTVLRLGAAACAGVPLGALFLVTVPAEIMRWAISIAILAALALLALGLGRKGEATPAGAYATGALSGLTSGSVGMGGPPVVLYYLAGRDPAAEIRASLICFFLVTAVLQIGAYTVNGALVWNNAVTGLALLPGFVLGSLLGTRLFHQSRESTYRRAAMTLIAVVAVLSLVV